VSVRFRAATEPSAVYHGQKGNTMTRSPATASIVAEPDPIGDPRVSAVLDRLFSDNYRSFISVFRRGCDPSTWSDDPHDFGDAHLSIRKKLGSFMYLICRASNVTRAVDFATSFGISAIYLAAAVRDNGGGMVIGSELVPSKAEAARQNLADAGLADFAEIRQGDARETLRDVGGPIDFALVDGFQGKGGGWVPEGGGPSLALSVLRLLAPQLRPGALVVNDNGEPDYLDYVRTPGNGFLTVPLPPFVEASAKADSGWSDLIRTLPADAPLVPLLFDDPGVELSMRRRTALKEFPIPGHHDGLVLQPSPQASG
jgi:hypothetical protein